MSKRVLRPEAMTRKKRRLANKERQLEEAMNDGLRNPKRAGQAVNKILTRDRRRPLVKASRRQNRGQ